MTGRAECVESRPDVEPDRADVGISGGKRCRRSVREAIGKPLRHRAVYRANWLEAARHMDLVHVVGTLNPAYSLVSFTLKSKLTCIEF